ncbi:PrgI family protein [Streptomyces acidiscabies]|uniref:PrgI family protein n=1 Tax=Streptomyces acidiscabies TaxID=42234 RepID=UPI000952EABB|nr:PrgI family protein [Streptomyces acidiscabies]
MTQPVRIPADIDRPDTVLAHLTARQLLILAVTGIVLYTAWSAVRAFVPVLVFLIPAIPLAAGATFIALGKRDGLPLDRLLLAAVRQHLSPRVQVAAPEGIHPAPAWLADRATQEPIPASPAALRLPAESVTEAGVIDLGTDGIAAIAVCGTVNFALRTPAEQDALVAGFGRYLHSLTTPAQILVRCQRLDLTAQISELRQRATSLPHPALEAAAREHADFLDQLAADSDLLSRQVLLVLREPVRRAASPGALSSLARLRKDRRREDAVDPAARRAAETRLVRRVQEAAGLLGPLGIPVTFLDAGQATAVLASACNPGSLLPTNAPLARADDIITTGTDGQPQ